MGALRGGLVGIGAAVTPAPETPLFRPVPVWLFLLWFLLHCCRLLL